MSYKIKNGYVYIQHNGTWFLEDVLYTLWPELKGRKLVRA